MHRQAVPYEDTRVAGVVYVVISDSLDRIETMLRRMVGADDDLYHDRLVELSRPTTSGYYLFPPAEALAAVW